MQVEKAPQSVVQYPDKLTNFFRRIMGLKPGQYVIIVTVKNNSDVKYKLGRLGNYEEPSA